ncbi:MAG: hypothetical protein CM1200mP26_02780 [Acidimicrobiales bacterium]|nr:MAG: hypothetical protein CM1200mP26_02780 [Acidimicrobiales bacterium]
MGARVCSGARNPLPSEFGFLATSPSTRCFPEVLCSEPPIKVEILDKKGSCHHSKAVVHETFSDQLAHPSVDERITRKAFGPGPKRFWVLVPPVASVPEVPPGSIGAVS